MTDETCSVTLSSSSFVFCSIFLMSSIVRSIHLSIQQNSCLWKWVNNRFSTYTRRVTGKWLHWSPGSQNHNLIPSESSFQSCCQVHARETWPWLVCRHTYVDSWGCLPVLSAHTYRHRWEITMSRNWTICTVMKQVTVKYLPIRSQRSSTRLLRLELGWIIFFFVILKEIPGIERTGPWQHAKCIRLTFGEITLLSAMSMLTISAGADSLSLCTCSKQYASS